MPRGRPKNGKQKENPLVLDLHPPAVQIKRKTNQLVYLSRTILNALIKHDESWPFLELITPQKIDIPEYYEIVKKPMSLRTVKKRLRNDFYPTARQAIEDVFSVFRNAYHVSEPHSAMSQMARNMEALFCAHLRKMPQWELELDPNGEVIQCAPQAHYLYSIDSLIAENCAEVQRVSSLDAAKTQPEVIDGVDERISCEIDANATIEYDDACHNEAIDSRTNELTREDCARATAALECLEADFKIYTKYIDCVLKSMKAMAARMQADDSPADASPADASPADDSRTDDSGLDSLNVDDDD